MIPTPAGPRPGRPYADLLRALNAEGAPLLLRLAEITARYRAWAEAVEAGLEDGDSEAIRAAIAVQEAHLARLYAEWNRRQADWVRRQAPEDRPRIAPPIDADTCTFCPRPALGPYLGNDTRWHGWPLCTKHMAEATRPRRLSAEEIAALAERDVVEMAPPEAPEDRG